MTAEGLPEIRTLKIGPFNESAVKKSSEIERKRKVHEAYEAKLSTIDIKDTESQKSLLDQAISAAYGYPIERRKLHPKFEPFVFLTEPGSDRFLVGDMDGFFDAKGQFHLKTIIIHDVCETKDEMRKLMYTIQSFNPGVPKVASKSFHTAFNPPPQA